jgi:putative glutamine amidotransferase|tara:strand:+ start:1334 stop:1888 length:555 start_codon:yes stop_codon:yes gene_type:complete
MKIGLTQRIFNHNNIAYDCLEHGWYQLLSGHTLSQITNNEDQNFEELVNSHDIIIFTGGDASPKRLLTEIRLLTECYKQNKPIIGVCHGAFFINKMEDGINDECTGHHNTEHEIIMHGKEYTVNSFHSNKIVTIGKNFDVLATTKDGDIEAFKHKTKEIFGIVWHPERMKETVLPDEVKRLLNE